MSEITRARPLQAALSSAAAFAVGATLPTLLAWGAPVDRLPLLVTGATLALLAILGAFAAGLGGAPRLRGALRVTFWGAIAMATTALIGRLFGTAV